MIGRPKIKNAVWKLVTTRAFITGNTITAKTGKSVNFLVITGPLLPVTINNVFDYDDNQLQHIPRWTLFILQNNNWKCLRFAPQSIRDSADDFQHIFWLLVLRFVAMTEVGFRQRLNRHFLYGRGYTRRPFALLEFTVAKIFASKMMLMGDFIARRSQRSLDMMGSLNITYPQNYWFWPVYLCPGNKTTNSFQCCG